MTEHAKFSPSAAYRWTVCPGSIRAQEGIEDKPSEAAIKGRDIHKLIEITMHNLIIPLFKDRPDLIGNQDVIASALIDSMEQCKDDIKNKIQVELTEEYIELVSGMIAGGFLSSLNSLNITPNASLQLLPEHRVQYKPDCWGTIDLVVHDPVSKQIIIIDFKTGDNPPSIFNNHQLELYALGYIKDQNSWTYDESYNLYICIIARGKSFMDRLFHDKLTYLDSCYQEKIQIVNDNPNTRIAGKHCTYCKAFSSCPTARNKALQHQMIPPIQKLTLEDKEEILDNDLYMRKFIEQVKADVLEELQTGTEYPNYKLKVGAQRKVIKDDAIPALERILGDKIYHKKIKTIAELTKTLDETDMFMVNDFITIKHNKPSIVRK